MEVEQFQPVAVIASFVTPLGSGSSTVTSPCVLASPTLSTASVYWVVAPATGAGPVRVLFRRRSGALTVEVVEEAVVSGVPVVWVEYVAVAVFEIDGAGRDRERRRAVDLDLERHDVRRAGLDVAAGRRGRARAEAGDDLVGGRRRTRRGRRRTRR